MRRTPDGCPKLALSYNRDPHCIVTPGTNVGEEIRKYGAGWVVEKVFFFFFVTY